MTAKSTRTATPADSTPDAFAPLNWLADLPRRQLTFALRSASTVFRGSEAIRGIQQQAAHRALSQHEAALERLRASRDVGEMMAVQTELIRFNLHEATQYWQQLASTAFKAQVDLVGSTSEVLPAAAEPTLEALQQAFAASLDNMENAAGPAAGASTH